MVFMETSIIGVALPKMHAVLGFSPSEPLVGLQRLRHRLGQPLVSGGKISDVFNARWVFSTGSGVLFGGSFVVGLAGNPAVELVGRAVLSAISPVQGADSALIAPSALCPVVHALRIQPEGTH